MKRLSADAKLVLLYLITNPYTHVSGIYILNRKLAAIDLGYSIDRVSRALDTLSKFGFCRSDSALDVIWVRKMMAYQGRGEKNARSAAAHVAEDLHNSFLCKEFLEAYPDVKAFVKPSFLDTLSEKTDRVSEFGTPDSRSRSLIPDPDPDNRERKSAPLTFGEFRSVVLTSEEHGKLEAKLNSHLPAYIDRLDRYSQTKPKEFAKYKSHYAVILTWFDRDVKEGKIHGTRLFDSNGPETPGTSSGTTSRGDPRYISKQR